MSKSMKAMRAARKISQSFCIFLLLLTCGPLSAQNQQHRIRNVVLVHGAWADGSGWKGITSGWPTIQELSSSSLLSVST